MSFRIEITDLAEGELKAIRAFERRRIVDEVREQLSRQPARTTEISHGSSGTAHG